MQKPCNLVGEKFGHLEVIQMVKGEGGYRAKCLCALCGNKITLNVGNLRCRKDPSCGCTKPPRARKPPLNDLTGQIFGFLKVQKMELLPVGRTRSTMQYHAICSCSNCGREGHPVLPGSLTRRRVISCGCRREHYKKFTGEKNPRFTGYKEIRGTTWRGIKERARRRKIPFSITIEEVWELYLRQNKECALSGLPIVFGRAGKTETTASVDRIDSSLPYLSTNIQLVHKNINLMKNILPQREFVELCEAVTRKANATLP